MARVVRAGPEGFVGGLSAGKYMNLTGASAATATRDLAELVTLEALHRSGERRHARYPITTPLRLVAPVEIDDMGNVK